MTPTSSPAPTPSRARHAADGGATAFARCLSAQLRDGEREAAVRVADAALAAGLSADAVRAKVIGPAMLRVGELWELGLATQSAVDGATGVCRHVLAHLHTLAPAERGSNWGGARVLLSPTPGERHDLGLSMIADTLRERGFRVAELSGEVSLARLRTAVVGFHAEVIGLSASTAASAAVLPGTLRALAESAPRARVMLGGRGVPPALWSDEIPRVSNALEVVEVVEDLLRSPRGVT